MTQKTNSYFFPLILVLYEIAIYLSNDMYLPALPDMMADLGLSSKQVQLTLTSWFLGAASMPLLMGVIADRFGRRLVLLSGGVIYILSTIGFAFANDIYVLLITRFLQGSMVSSMLVPGYASIHELYKQKDAIKVLALMSSISVLAPALGPLFGSMVLFFTNWRGIFWIIAIWSTLFILLLYKWMPETQPLEKRHPINIVRLLKEYWQVIKNKRYMRLMCVLGLIFTGWIAWITAGPLLVIDNFHFSKIEFGVIQAIVFAAYIVGTRVVKSLVDKKEIPQIIKTGIAISLLGGFLVFLLAIAFPYSLYPFLGGLLIYSFGSALCFSTLNRSIIESSDEPMGVRVALFSVFLAGFAVLGSAMASLMFNGSILSLSILITIAIVLALIKWIS
jgi:Bcr/CflA subfamily drug resistance transporter